MRNPIGQLIATKYGEGWILGMVLKPYENPYPSSDVYEVEWYCEDGNALKKYSRSVSGDLLKQLLTAYRHLVRAKVYKGTFKGD